MERTNHDRGRHAEAACCRFLQKQGLKLLDKNYRGKNGEIDLVMQEKDTVVFVEVRFRKNNLYGGAIESITPQKKQRIVATAEHYLQNTQKLKNARIDVVAMTQKPQNTPPVDALDEYEFTWIKNAF